MANEKSVPTSRASFATSSVNESQQATATNVEEKSKIDAEDARLNRGEDEEYITGFRLFAVMFGVSLVAFLIMLDTTIVATAIPKITDEFDSLPDIGWYGSAYLLALASLQPLSGKIYQYYSSKKAFLTGVAIFELGSLISGAANSSKLLIFGRALSGIGGSGLMTGLVTIIASSVPLEKRPSYTSAGMGLAMMGLLFGPLIGGAFTEHVTWRLCFYINLPLGAITAITLFFIRIPDAKSSTNTRPTWREAIIRLDLVGCALFIPPCLMLLIALGWGGIEYPWYSSIIIGLLCGSGVSFIIFLIWEHTRGSEAMIPLPMISQRVVACAAITTLLSSATQFLAAYYLPLYFQAVKGVDPTTSGIYSFPSVGSTIVGAILAGLLSTKSGYYTPFSIFGCALAAIGSGLLGMLEPGSPAAHWAGFAVIAGLGRGMGMTQTITAVQVVLSKRDLPIGNSVILFSQSMGGALFVSFGQTMFANRLRPELTTWAPEVNAATIISVGATKFRGLISAESVPGVVMAYNQSLTITFYLGAAAAAVSVGTSFGLGWTNLKTLKKEEGEEGDVVV